MTTIAQQGHLYRWHQRRVIALATGPIVPVRVIDPDAPLGIGRRQVAKAAALTPLPMKYFHGQIPAEPNTETTP